VPRAAASDWGADNIQKGPWGASAVSHMPRYTLLPINAHGPGLRFRLTLATRGSTLPAFVSIEVLPLSAAHYKKHEIS